MNILSAKRTPLAPAGGAYAQLRPDEMIRQLVNYFISTYKLEKQKPNELILGCAIQEGPQAQNIARNSVLLSDLEDSTPALSINRMDGSSSDAIHMAYQKIALNEADLILAGGVENMTYFSQNPKINTPHPELLKQNPDACVPMLVAAEEMALKNSLTRPQLDQYALQSHLKASKAIDEDLFIEEILPIKWHEKGYSPQGIKDYDNSLSSDELPRDDLKKEHFQQTLPSLKRDGLITQMNTAPVADGASLLLMASDQMVEKLNVSPLAKYIGSEISACSPAQRGESCDKNINKLLDKHNLSLSDIDLFQIGESFASSALSLMNKLKLDSKKVNINGGSIGLGQAIGATGSNLITQMAYQLKRNKLQYGLISYCVSGGMSYATIIQNKE